MVHDHFHADKTVQMQSWTDSPQALSSQQTKRKLGVRVESSFGHVAARARLQRREQFWTCCRMSWLQRRGEWSAV